MDNQDKNIRYYKYLAHHDKKDCKEKCLVFIGSYVCSRCAGLYPLMILGLVIGFILDVSPVLAEKMYFIAITPTWSQWAMEELGLYPRTRITKWIRFFTAMPGGWSLGILLTTHFKNPWNEHFMQAFSWTFSLSFLVLIISFIKSWLTEE